MRKISTLYTFIVCTFIVSFLLTPSPPQASAAETRCYPVNIQSKEGVEPEVLTISKGQCVEWVNLTKGVDVKVTFKRGKDIAERTISAKRFALDPAGSFIAVVPFGETASLTFAEPGRFEYQAVMQLGGYADPDTSINLSKPSGTIHVK